MTNPAGESNDGALRLDFDRRLMLQFRGSVVTSDAGLLAYCELGDALGLTTMVGELLADARTSKNGRIFGRASVHLADVGLDVRERKMPRPGRASWRLLGIFLASACSSNIAANRADAVENITPFLPGVTIGAPVGMLPPPGLYFTSANADFSMYVKNDQGQNTGIRVQDPSTNDELLYVPDIPPIFGATYGALIIQSLRGPSTSIPETGTFSNLGLVNTVISPLNLSWNLHNGFFVSVALTTYGPAFHYQVAAVQNTSRNYATIEPGVGISYLANGWNLTAHPLFDFNFTNPANGYRSGTLFMMDYTALRKLGNFQVGLGGTLTTQISDDAIHGTPVPAVPGINGYGNRAENLTIGPVFHYDFGKVGLTAYYTASVYARNTAAGNNFWLRLEVPLFSSPRGAEPHSQ